MPNLPPDRILRALSSLRITVVLIALVVLLIFFGSLAQRFDGIWHVLEMYFKQPVVWVDFKIFASAQRDLPGSFPFFGGVTLGVAMLINLAAAFALKFQPTRKLPFLLGGALAAALGATLVAVAHIDPKWRHLLTSGPVSMLGGGLLLYAPITLGFFLLYGKRAGLVMIHAAVIFLIVGQGVTSYRALESNMVLRPGDTLNYSEDPREYELAIATPKQDGSGADEVACIPQWMLREKSEGLKAYGLQVDEFFANTQLNVATEAKPDPLLTFPPPAEAPMLVGKRLSMAKAETVTGFGDNMNNMPGVVVRAKGHAIALYGGDNNFKTVPGTRMRLRLRPKRYFLPYAIRLEKFTHDLYPGTNTPKNYASSVTVLEKGKAPRKVEISMNQPLRLHNDALFQASFLKDDAGTVLQVVRNPVWPVPYIACALGAIGLLAHFFLSLGKFLKRNSSGVTKSDQKKAKSEKADSPAERTSVLGWLLPTLVAAISIGVLAFATQTMWVITPTLPTNPITAFGQTPVIAGGRVQPIDSLARNHLLSLAGRSSLHLPGKDGAKDRTLSASQWLLDVIAKPDLADTYPVIRIDHEEVKDLIGQKDSKEKRFSMAQILPHLSDKALNEAYASAANTPKEKRDARENALLELNARISQYSKLRDHTAWLGITPPHAGNKRDPAGWLPLPDAMEAMMRQHMASDAQIMEWAKTLNAWQNLPNGMAKQQQQVDAWHNLQQAWAKGDTAAFNSAVANLHQAQAEFAPASAKLTAQEAAFNQADPFYRTLWLYVCAALTVFASWAFWKKPLWRTAFTLVGIAFILHTCALLARMWISGRPPVTNLYSSAIFVGWGLAGFSLAAEFVLARFMNLRLGFALLVGAVAGAATLLIAQILAADGSDTIGVLQAVLDTNFWLATHVTIITLGYSATFLAGLLGILYLATQFFIQDRALLRAVTGVIYGTLCFALLASFVGTILGGIWADQSWGRFWGWDPKENGAMMIVLWNALILHARMGHLVKERGLAALAVLGNVVTAWSWFGVNQLGAGLHSYGFTDSAAFWLVVFVLVNVGIAGLGLLPGRKKSA